MDQSLSLSVSLSRSLNLSLTHSVFLCPSLFLCVCPPPPSPIRLRRSLCFYLYVSLFPSPVSLPPCSLSICVPLCVSLSIVCLSVCLSVCVSLSRFVSLSLKLRLVINPLTKTLIAGNSTTRAQRTSVDRPSSSELPPRKGSYPSARKL